MMALVAIVVAVHVSENNDPTQDEKYTGASRSVLSYVLGGAECFVLLDKKPRGKRSQNADIEVNRMPVAHLPPYGRNRNVQSIHGTSSSYGWLGQVALESHGQTYLAHNLDKPLPHRPVHVDGYGQHNEHTVAMPARMARPLQSYAVKAMPEDPILVIYLNRAGYYNAARKEAHSHRND
ncbi:hypothetical protein PSPO01_15405 [Paraphaeosphaeria sporulosa]